MAQWIKAFDAKPLFDPSLIPGTWWKERTHFYKLCSDFICTLWQVNLPLSK